MLRRPRLRPILQSSRWTGLAFILSTFLAWLTGTSRPSGDWRVKESILLRLGRAQARPLSRTKVWPLSRTKVRPRCQDGGAGCSPWSRGGPAGWRWSGGTGCWDGRGRRLDLGEGRRWPRAARGERASWPVKGTAERLEEAPSEEIEVADVDESSLAGDVAVERAPTLLDWS